MKWIFVVLSFLIWASAPSLSYAQENPGAPQKPTDSAAKPEPVQAENEATKRLMRDLKAHLEKLNSEVYGYGPRETTDESIKAHAAMILKLAQEIPGYDDAVKANDTVSSESYAQNQEEFEAASMQLQSSMKAFLSVLKSGDANKIREKYHDLNISSICASCHDEFRKK